MLPSTVSRFDDPHLPSAQPQLVDNPCKAKRLPFSVAAPIRPGCHVVSFFSTLNPEYRTLLMPESIVAPLNNNGAIAKHAVMAKNHGAMRFG
jgi:hypothetical protein